MCAQKQYRKRNLFVSVLGNRCPRCREGRLFTYRNPYKLGHSVDMPQHCPVCGQPYELQTGFYFGTGYVSYTLCVGFIGVFYALCYMAGLVSLQDNSIYYWLVANTALLIILQPIIQRLSRSIWIAFFVRYDPDATAGAAK